MQQKTEQNAKPEKKTVGQLVMQIIGFVLIGLIALAFILGFLKK